jgi:hypothetical protein
MGTRRDLLQHPSHITPVFALARVESKTEASPHHHGAVARPVVHPTTHYVVGPDQFLEPTQPGSRPRRENSA